MKLQTELKFNFIDISPLELHSDKSLRVSEYQKPVLYYIILYYGNIVIEVCQATWTSLRDIYWQKQSISDFENTANAFYNKWNFPNCIGSIDGKHIGTSKMSKQLWKYVL